MDIKKLFETQAALDEHIMQEHPELRGQNNLDWKILALQVELGECANEWRGFKKWSKDQEPRTYKVVHCHSCKGNGFFLGFQNAQEDCTYCEGTGVQEECNPLLVEYVDCLHFILSIGLELDTKTTVDWDDIEFFETDITEQFIEVISRILELRSWESSDTWAGLFSEFYVLGKMLGFTWEQVEEAYYAKNKVNHERQNAGY
ncbi:dUTP diphosphatase [Lysinibacillus sphaericus]|uniref:dUTP diphosphatase n=1 Tax=Lysinibacillus sphaericus TaxID=1421 RepID=UPI00055B8684|nr:dUTP diphosphatase [Lysinibacillus sphaericus]